MRHFRTVTDPPTLDPAPTPLADRLEAAVADMVELRGPLEARAPWPPSPDYGTGPEASWGPGEILAHLDEMLPYWLGEIERILDGDPDAGPIDFGRTAEDPLRLAVIGRDRTVPPRELVARLASSGTRVAARMRSLTARQAGRRGRHPVRGEMTVAAILERMVVAHTEDHLAQLRRALDTAAG
jgi:hypothetical protein